ncbi:MAG: hypothetical protein M3Z83_05400 [Actinomycetota bacterium]|nr:hypothetical protein [Actinomycetota bacterium]
MHQFSATTESTAVVAADRAAIWAVLTEPDVLARLTPLLQRIETDGNLWRWELQKLPVLGIAVDPTFTERMTFTDQERIEFTHAPPAGAGERAGAEGWYELSDADRGTHLAISLTLQVELPLSRLAAPAVGAVMMRAMSLTGDRFATNLERHLGLR